MAKPIRLVTISIRWGDEQAEQRLVRMDGSELCANTTKVSDHISDCLNSIKSTISPAILSDEVPQLQTYLKEIMEVHNAPSNNMDLGFSRVADCSEIVEQTSVASLTPAPTAPVPKERYKLHSKETYSSDTHSVFSKHSSALCSEKNPRLSRDASP